MTIFDDPRPATVAGPKPPPTVMRGPAHADNYRIKVGRYKDRWYTDPLPADDLRPAAPDESYPSVSIVKGASGKDWSYVSLKRIAHSDDLDQIAARGFYERYERFKVINQLDLSAAQRRGTNVHSWAECIAYGIPQYLSPNGEGGNYFATVDKFFADHNPTLLAAEFVCVHRNLHGIGYGGTSDGIFEIDGRLYMVDWKSRGEDSDHGCYPEEAGQIGGYVGCEYIIIEDDDPRNPHGAKRDYMPNLDGGLIVSIKPDSYEVYPIDLHTAVEHWHAMHAWWVARRSESQAVGSKWPPRRNTPAAVEPPAEPSLEHQLQESLEHVAHKKHLARKEALYDRHAKLTKAQQAEFAERVVGLDASDLDVVEHLIDEILNPPTVLDMAKARMARDDAHEAARRLSLEGGPANPDDVAEFELRWEMGGMTDAGMRWVGRVVKEAIDGHRDFRLSAFSTQRRADTYCALTEWAVKFDDSGDDRAFRGALAAVTPLANDADPIGVIVGSLTATEAAALRTLVTEIAEGRMMLVIDLDGAHSWA